MPDSPVRIGIAVVEHQRCYLVGTRGPDGPLPGYAEFPGGKCLPGESPGVCARRECLEETGLEVITVSLLMRRQFTYPHAVCDLNFWLCHPLAHVDVRPQYGSYRWVPVAELPALTFPEANAPLIKLLTERAPQ